MGDTRFTRVFEAVKEAENALTVMGTLSDEGVIHALAGASKARDPYLANVLATEAANRARLKTTIVSAASDGVFSLDRDGMFTFLNPAAARMLMEDPDEHPGEEAHGMLHAHGCPEGSPCPLLAALRDGEIHESDDDVFSRADGRTFRVEYTASPIVHDGEQDGIVVVFRDTTEHHKAQEALQRIEWLLGESASDAAAEECTGQAYGDLTKLNTSRLILESVGHDVLASIARDYLELLDSSSAIYEENGDYALGLFSSGWCRYLDQASRDLCGTDDNEEALASGKWHCHEGCWNDASKPAMETGAPVDVECPGGIRLYAVPIRADGRIVGAINFGYGNPPTDRARLEEIAAKYEVPVEELAKRARAYATRPPFIVEMAKKRIGTSAKLIGEIVQRKLAEERLSETNRNLERRIRERTRDLEEHMKELESFSYSVSHDLRAPLRGIELLSRILEEEYGEALDEDGRATAGRLRRESERMTRLVNDLFTLSRVKHAEVRRSRVDVTALAREVGSELRDANPAHRVRFEVAEGVDAHADPDLLRIVLKNLLENAWKYTGRSGGAQVRFGSLAPSDASAPPVYFVRDNGAGFDPAEADRLFSAFQRLHTDQEFQGTGIGLATVKRIVERHGGRAWAEGAIGEGATFYFTLAPSC